jgi:MFS family permease
MPMTPSSADRPRRKNPTQLAACYGLQLVDPNRPELGWRKKRRRLGPARAFAAVAALVGVAGFASSAPSPLYADYAAKWHFSTAVLTTVYGIYPLGVLVGLLVLGRLSDEIGRRPVLAAALVGLAGSLVLFAAARSTWWLLGARLLQGVSTGPLISAAAAALLDLEPAKDSRRAGLVNSTCMVLGIGTGALVSSALVQGAPDPRVTPYILLLVFAVGAVGAVAALPERVGARVRPRLRLQWPHVPVDVRGHFALASAAAVVSFSIGGMYLSLAPGLADELLHTRSHLAGGLAVFALGATAGMAQIARRSFESEQATRRGCVAMAAGMTLIVISLSIDSAVVFWAGCVATGAGVGLAFMGAGRTIAMIAPARQRAGVMTAFYVVAYLSLSVPAVVSGLAVTGIGLEPTFRIFGVAVIALALATAAKTRVSSTQPASRT